MQWSVNTVIEALKPWYVSNSGARSSATLGNIITDSRTIEPGCIFLAIKGDRFDGHDYALQAAQKGAACLVLEKSVGADIPEVIVSDTKEAYGALASAWRHQFKIPVIEVAGANGKTTTTQMIAAILRAALPEKQMLATKGNFNNDIGVPKMMLELNRFVKAAVFEAGISHPGEMAQLSSWIKPTVVAITNAQREHQEFLGTVEGSARENGLALVALSANGTAVLPAADPCFSIWADIVRARGCQVLTYAEGNVSAMVQARAMGAISQFVTPKGSFSVALQIAGRHALHDAAAAVAATLAIGVPLKFIEKGLASFKPVSGRGVRHSLPNGSVVIDDAYNANPDSVRAAIDVLMEMPSPRVLVLGDMGEVGEKSAQYHAEIGQYAKQRGIDRLYATGNAMKNAVEAFGAGARHCETMQELTQCALGEVKCPSTVLVKASRFMQLDKVVKILIDQKDRKQ